MTKLAVVLFNLGGPDRLQAVRPFLFNLFNDPAIIDVAPVLRRALAWLISTRRAPVARRIDQQLGGGSPLLGLTEEQAGALQQALGGDSRVFIAMRYWHPMTEAAVAAVKAWNPDRIVLLPLYPQYSTTTTASSFAAWTRAAAAAGVTAPTVSVCCYPTLAGMIEAQTHLLEAALAKAPESPRVLFSAHGLPVRVVDRGDPYPLQVEMTAKAIVKRLGRAELDWRICYQSRVGRLEWIGPGTDAELKQAGREGKAVVILPIAFVSEHSETLVELDIEYAHLAAAAGVTSYIRVPALGSDPAFIGALAELTQRALSAGCEGYADHGARICPMTAVTCPHAGASVQGGSLR